MCTFSWRIKYKCASDLFSIRQACKHWTGEIHRQLCARSRTCIGSANEQRSADGRGEWVMQAIYCQKKCLMCSGRAQKQKKKEAIKPSRDKGKMNLAFIFKNKKWIPWPWSTPSSSIPALLNMYARTCTWFYDFPRKINRAIVFFSLLRFFVFFFYTIFNCLTPIHCGGGA